MSENNYFSIAERAYKGIIRMYQVGSENEFSAQAQKTAERYLKHILIEYPPDKMEDSLLKTHSLKKLYRALDYLDYLNLDRDIVYFLNGFYFEASYPGDNFILVTKEEEIQCKQSLDHIRENVIRFLNSRNINSEKLYTNEFNE